MTTEIRFGHPVLGTFIDALSWDQVLDRIAAWADARASRYVCLCNVHSIVTAADERTLAAALDGSDLSLPDGMPIAIALRRAGFAGQPRLSGPDLMWRYCARAADLGQSIFLYGATDATLAALERCLLEAFPALRVAGRYAPPFRAAVALEDRAVLDRINASGAGAVFVGLGCPKQELWMALHRPHLRAVLIGVGAAFDYHAGTARRAPRWAQQCGLEWAFRLAAEPRRLWRRYLGTNTRFVLESLLWRAGAA